MHSKIYLEILKLICRQPRYGQNGSQNLKALGNQSINNKRLKNGNTKRRPNLSKISDFKVCNLKKSRLELPISERYGSFIWSKCLIFETLETLSYSGVNSIRGEEKTKVKEF